MKKVNEAVNKVCKQEHRELLAKDDSRLAGSRNIWRYAEENLPDRHHKQMKMLRRMDREVGRAWAPK